MSTAVNPVRRLRDILETARAQPPSEGTAQVWKVALGLRKSEGRTFIRALDALLDLVGSARSAVMQIDVKHDDYIKAFANIESLIARLPYNTKWGQISTPLDELTMLRLQYAADLIDGKEEVHTFDRTELGGIQKRIEALQEEVLSSNFPDELREILLQKLEDIRQAILIYRVSGMEGVRQAVEGALGALWLQAEHLGEIEDEKQRHVLREVVSVLADICQIMQIVLPALKLAAPIISGLLTTGSR